MKKPHFDTIITWRMITVLTAMYGSSLFFSQLILVWMIGYKNMHHPVEFWIVEFISVILIVCCGFSWRKLMKLEDVYFGK